MNTSLFSKGKKFMVCSGEKAQSSVTGGLAQWQEYRLWPYCNVIIM